MVESTGFSGTEANLAQRALAKVGDVFIFKFLEKLPMSGIQEGLTTQIPLISVNALMPTKWSLYKVPHVYRFSANELSHRAIRA